MNKILQQLKYSTSYDSFTKDIMVPNIVLYINSAFLSYELLNSYSAKRGIL